MVQNLAIRSYLSGLKLQNSRIKLIPFSSQIRENGEKSDNKLTPFWIKFIKVAKNGKIRSFLSDLKFVKIAKNCEIS